MQEIAERDESLVKIKDELSRTKADNRMLERELLETIQKKIKLSQQVEQWQVRDVLQLISLITLFLLDGIYYS